MDHSFSSPLLRIDGNDALNRVHTMKLLKMGNTCVFITWSSTKFPIGDFALYIMSKKHFAVCVCIT